VIASEHWGASVTFSKVLVAVGGTRSLRTCRSGVRFTPGALCETGTSGWSGYLREP